MARPAHLYVFCKKNNNLKLINASKQYLGI